MINIHRALLDGKSQDADALTGCMMNCVFDVYRSGGEKKVRPLIEEKMKTAIPLDAPIVRGDGIGRELAGELTDNLLLSGKFTRSFTAYGLSSVLNTTSGAESKRLSTGAFSSRKMGR